MEEIYVRLLDVLAVVLPAMLTALGAYATFFIRTRMKEGKTKSIMWKANDIIYTVVMSLQQTLVKQLKAKAEDGKLTLDEMKIVRGEAIRQFKRLMGPAGIDELQKLFGYTDNDLTVFILAQIEAQVAGLDK